MFAIFNNSILNKFFILNILNSPAPPAAAAKQKLWLKNFNN